MKKQLLAVVGSILLLLIAVLSAKAQPLAKSAIQVDPGNTKLTGATFSYRLTYNCTNGSGPCLGGQVVDLLPPGVQFVSTVPASPTGDVAAINVTPNFMGTGRTRVQFILINPLSSGNSGDLLINVRFPNGATPNGTVATNTADAINMETIPGTFTTPPVNVTAEATAQATTSLILTSAPANLDMPENYRYRFSVPNADGALNFTQAGPVTVTLHPGTVFNGATPAADCQPGCVGTTPATVTFTSPFSLPIQPNQDRDIFLNVTFPSATFPSGTSVTTSATIDATPLGEPLQSFNPASLTHTVTTFIPNPSAGFTLNMAGGTPNPPTLNQTFSYDMNITNNGNVPLSNQVVIFTVPVEMQITSITTGIYNSLSDFAAGEGVRVSYEKNTAPGVFTLWGSSPNTITNTTLTAPPPGLGAGEYITRIRWEYGQAAVGMSSATRPLITGRIINPDNAGGPVAIGDPIQACASLTAVYTGGPTNVNQNDCENFNVAGPFVQFNPAKENLSGGGPFNPGQTVSFRLRVRSAAQSSDPIPLENVIVTDLLPEGLNFSAWVFDDQGTGLPAPQVFDQIPDFAGTGRTLLRWRWNAGSGSLGVNQQVWINISTPINFYAVQGPLSNDLTLDSDAPGLAQRCSGSSQTDALDYDGDGDTAENLCRATGTITVSSAAAPRVQSIVRTDPSPTGATMVSWQVTFNEDVIGLNASNFMLVGIPDALITNVVTENATASDDVWMVTASTGTGSGMLGLNLVNSTGASDVQFTSIPINPLDLPFVGEVYDIDQTPPTTMITMSPPNPTNTNSAMFSFTGDDGAGTGVAGFECQLDGGGFSPCSSPQNFINLSDGSHTFEVRAIDNVGNVDLTPASYTWLIDTTPPSVTINQGAGQTDPTSTSPIVFDVVFLEPVTDFDDPSDVSLAGSTAPGILTVLITPISTTNYTVSVSGMTGDGLIVASIPDNVAIDIVGNSNTASISIDNTVTFIFCAAEAGQITNSGSSNNLTICEGSDPGFTFSAENEQTEATYFYAFLLANAGGTILQFNTTGDFDLTTLAAGTYTVYGLSYANFNTPNTIAAYLVGKTIADIQMDDVATDFCLELTGAVVAEQTNIIHVNGVSAGTIATSQTVCTTRDPAPFSSEMAATGSGMITYQWESSTVNCEDGFAPIDGATAATFDPAQGQFPVTTYFRRRAISTLNELACDAVSNCVVLTVLNVDCGQFPWNGN